MLNTLNLSNHFNEGQSTGAQGLKCFIAHKKLNFRRVEKDVHTQKTIDSTHIDILRGKFICNLLEVQRVEEGISLETLSMLLVNIKVSELVVLYKYHKMVFKH